MPGFIGFPELLLLGLVALLLFGPKRLPEMGRGLGHGLREFKDSVSGDNKSEHHLDASKFKIPSESTPEPVSRPIDPVAESPLAEPHTPTPTAP